nr:MAG TPA: hypothetical protein [Caudoviricetes sp.]
MNDKITKQHIYSELTIRLDKIEYMLEKVLTALEGNMVTNLTITPTADIDVDEFIKKWNEATGRSRWMTNQEFDEEMK